MDWWRGGADATPNAFPYGVCGLRARAALQTSLPEPEQIGRARVLPPVLPRPLGPASAQDSWKLRWRLRPHSRAGRQWCLPLRATAARGQGRARESSRITQTRTRVMATSIPIAKEMETLGRVSVRNGLVGQHAGHGQAGHYRSQKLSAEIARKACCRELTLQEEPEGHCRVDVRA